MNRSASKEKTISCSSNSLKLTRTLIDQYQDSLLSRGCKKQTINMYLCYLNRLYDYLQEDRHLTDENLKNWIVSLQEKGFSERTVNLHISSVNGLLKYCGQKKVSVALMSVPREAELPELTREEYLRLLFYARQYGSERDYLLIKTLVSVDLTVNDLSYLTKENCQNGVIVLPHNKMAFIPECLKMELLAYTKKSGIRSGVVFVSRYGNALDRYNITHKIEQLGKGAGIEAGKSNPRALHKLYQKTQERINHELMTFRWKAYEELLNAEQEIMVLAG